MPRGQAGQWPDQLVDMPRIRIEFAKKRLQEMADELGAHRAKEFNVGVNPAKIGAPRVPSCRRARCARAVVKSPKFPSEPLGLNPQPNSTFTSILAMELWRCF